MNIFDYYRSADAAQRRPTLLEFSKPISNSSLEICGIDPSCTLEIKNGRLFKDGIEEGPALQIFDHLELPKRSSFFPAYLGFFSYEFASYFDKPCHPGNRLLPDAFFRRYERGVVIDAGKIIHHDFIDPNALPLIGSESEEQKLTPALSKQDFIDTVTRIKKMIRQGDVYQVNFSLPYFFDATNIHPHALYDSLRALNKSPFMGMISNDNWHLLSGSPERLFSLHNNLISARPIAGTKKRGQDSFHEKAELFALTTCVKENAEHAMLVDLMRNDLNRIALPQTVVVEEDRSIEFYSHVMHLVSELRAKSDKPFKEIIQSIFPGGTITGAPKLSVMNAIAELESCPRGPYTGSFGYISSGFGVDLNIIIRSVVKLGDRGWTNTGAGIVIDSDPEREWEEVNKKASALKDILAKKSTPKPLRCSIKGPRLKTDTSLRLFEHCRVLFLENQDSFSFNIVEALRSLGALVKITHEADFSLDQYTHVVIGPGPGNPADMPKLSYMIDQALKSNVPLLGICLGHQALGHSFGANVKEMVLPIHGKSQTIYHQGNGLFAGLKQPSNFTRYHSLVIDRAPSEFLVDAFSDDDHIMAIRHQKKPLFGVQFHPESYLSQEGHLLLSNFLRSSGV